MSRLFFVGCATLVALGHIGGLTPTWAGEMVDLRVGCVLASNSGVEFDQRLVALQPRFNRLFHYTSYSLVNEKREQVAMGAKMGFDVPGDRYLIVIPKELSKDGRLALKVMLLEGSRPIVDTTVSLRTHSTFLVAGPQHNGGALILSIGAEVTE